MFTKYKLTFMALLLTGILIPGAYSAQENDREGVKRVLLISIDGMHALDFQNCSNNGTCPHLAALAAHGVTYTRAQSSR